MLENRKLVLTNIISSVIQVVLIALVYFFLYRFLLAKLGVELLGVWSVVLSTSSLASLANAGIATSVVRFAAMYTAQNSPEKLKRLSFTAFLMMLVLFIAICAVLYPFAAFILGKIIPAGYINDALDILPYSIICFIINAGAGVYASILDGAQKNYIKSVIFSTSSIVLLIFSIILVDSYGFKGLAYAQVIQSAYSFMGCIIMVGSIFKFNPFKWNWDKDIFKDIFGYGIKYQFISFASMLNDPLTKALIVNFGGLAIAGYYEMANRLLSQFKGVIVNACQSLVPVMVNMSVKHDNAIKELYTKTVYYVFYLSLSGIGVILMAGGIISYLWIGHFEITFIIVLLLLGVSFFSNLLNVPAYFSFMSGGNLNILIWSHIIMSLLNVVLGFSLGYLFKGTGIITATSLSVIAGSLYTIYAYQKKYGITWEEIADKKMLFALIGFLILIISVFFTAMYSQEREFIFYTDAFLLAILFLLLYFVFMKQLYFSWINKKKQL